MQYIEYARREKANRKLNQILTQVLRLQPTKPELWIYAAKYALETLGDVGGARGYMQRGLRFCKGSKDLWLQYGNLEMIYIAKIAARREILGLGEERKKNGERTEDADLDDSNADIVALPTITAEDINPSFVGAKDAVDDDALRNLGSTPALSGAIPIAIFDAAMKQFNHGSVLAERFFTLFAQFPNVVCLRRILQHIVDSMLQSSPDDVETQRCNLRLPLVVVRTSAPEFPAALWAFLERTGTAMKKYPQFEGSLALAAVVELSSISAQKDIDTDVERVVLASLRKYLKRVVPDAVSDLVTSLHERNELEQAQKILLLTT